MGMRAVGAPLLHLGAVGASLSAWVLCPGIRSAALWWIMSNKSSVEGGGVPEMLAKLRRGDESGSPRWERFAMRLVVGHLLAYNIPGLDKVP